MEEGGYTPIHSTAFASHRTGSLSWFQYNIPLFNLHTLMIRIAKDTLKKKKS